ncbi:3-hydroxy-3-methylglutaryl-coenzyme A reductase 1 [Vitis vinifera]|uniref:hydroxymethylglutaryl-CoA reductase (NADPH) n=1 Tax=Vitis vinifera TaxID=29760 RepID=A0A438H358_VITVI|nr:3-hydroxy-3-methylglutaryl-coenzyme A reductase 1 [Vitis vinifera]
MDVRRRPPMRSVRQSSTTSAGEPPVKHLKPSDALPLPLYLTNGIFFALFFSVAYFLLHRWREKIRTSTPLHVLTLSEIAAIVSMLASVIYLLGFFGVDFVQSLVTRPSGDVWDAEDEPHGAILEEDSRPGPCAAAIDCSPPPKVADVAPVTVFSSEEEEEMIRSVVAGLFHPTCSSQNWVIVRERQRSEGRPCRGPQGDSGGDSGAAAAGRKGVLGANGDDGRVSGGKYQQGVFPTASRAANLKLFVEDPINFDTLAVVFNRSSRFARLQGIHCAIAGKNLYMRFGCSTGDAMGMNMVSKGVQNVLDFLQTDFPDMDVIGISGNFCSDKKPAAVNWIEGRGKSVVCEAIIGDEVVRKVLKTSVAALVELNMLKNLTGSAVAGALGGFNAHASNIVSAVYIATGQDPAQNVESSHCITMMEAVNDGKDFISQSPCLPLRLNIWYGCMQVGTVGGGTQLASQSACLNLLGVKGASKESPGSNSRLLATIVAGSVLAGELSLMSAIAAGQLVKSHLKYNRSSRDVSKIAS